MIMSIGYWYGSKTWHSSDKYRKHFIEAIRELGETVTEFENGLFGELVDYMTVYKDKTIKVTFKDGTEI